MEKPNLDKIRDSWALDDGDFLPGAVTEAMYAYGKQMFNYALHIALLEAQLGTTEERSEELKESILKHQL